MNQTSLLLLVILIFGLFNYTPGSNPLAFTFLAIVLVIHVTNHTWKIKPSENAKH